MSGGEIEEGIEEKNAEIYNCVIAFFIPFHFAY
jgi:hypothetical protein